MKKIVVLLLFVFTFSLHSFEWGGVLNESISNSKESYTEDSFLFTQKNCLDLWFQTPIAQKENLSFMFNTSFDLKFDYYNEDCEILSIIDFDLLHLSYFKNFSSFSFSSDIGRIEVNDITKKIVSQKIDGIKGSFELVNFSADFYLGFTGLLNALNNRMLDVNGEPFAIEGINYIFATNLFPYSLSITFPTTSRKNKIICEFTGVGNSKQNRNRYYGTLGFGSDSLKYFTYQLSTTVGIEDFRNISNLTVLYFKFLPFELLSFDAEVTYASGNQYYLSSFTGLTSFRENDYLLHKEVSEQLVMAAGACFNNKFFEGNLQVKCLFDFPESELYFSGVLINSTVDFSIFSDLYAGVSGILFFDVIDNWKQNLFNFSLNCKLLF